jgi:hypothetical protein
VIELSEQVVGALADQLLHVRLAEAALDIERRCRTAQDPEDGEVQRLWPDQSQLLVRAQQVQLQRLQQHGGEERGTAAAAAAASRVSPPLRHHHVLEQYARSALLQARWDGGAVLGGGWPQTQDRVAEGRDWAAAEVESSVLQEQEAEHKQAYNKKRQQQQQQEDERSTRQEIGGPPHKRVLLSPSKDPRTGMLCLCVCVFVCVCVYLCVFSDVCDSLILEVENSLGVWACIKGRF